MQARQLERTDGLSGRYWSLPGPTAPFATLLINGYRKKICNTNTTSRNIRIFMSLKTSSQSV